MALPTIELPTETVTAGGQDFLVRGLSRAETLALAAVNEAGDVVETEIHVLATVFAEAVDDVRDWYNKTPSHVVVAVLNAVNRLSGLDDLGKESSED